MRGLISVNRRKEKKKEKNPKRFVSDLSSIKCTLKKKTTEKKKKGRNVPRVKKGDTIGQGLA